MTELLGIIFLAAAVLIRVVHEVVRTSGHIQLRQLVEDAGPGSVTASSHLDHPAYFRAALSAWEIGVAVTGALLVVAGDLASTGDALLFGVVLITAGIYATVSAIAAGLGRSAGSNLVNALAPVAAPLIRIAALIHPPADDESANANGERPTDDEAEREAVEVLIKEGVREGIGASEDMKLVSGVMDLRDRTVGDVMVKREDVFALPANLPTHEIAERIAASGYSRVPIYTGSLDVIIGIFHVLDVLKAGRNDLPPLRPAATAVQTERCSELLQRLLRQQSHICVVTDGAGHTTGIVTLEDLLEEIVGEIRDEFDEPAPGVVHARR